MAILEEKHIAPGFSHTLRDTRPIYTRLKSMFSRSPNAFVTLISMAAVTYSIPMFIYYIDIIFAFACFYFYYLISKPRDLTFRMPQASGFKDVKNVGGGRNQEPEGILYLGNDRSDDREIWFTNSDARTHILYLGTTGAGKTEGLKSMVTNALCWGSGFLFIDGKADTDLWSTLSALARRFGRDDDLFVLNYMTGNSDDRALSNTMNPFASGSAAFLKEMLVSLMPEAEGDNVMWKERAVALLAALMPAMTYKRDHQDMPLTVRAMRKYIEFHEIIAVSRDETIPERIREGLVGYLDTLPGYVAECFDDNGKEKPPGPDVPQVDPVMPRQQHGYLTMQFTRALQSLGDDYGYIFDSQHPDVNMLDIILNRRILVVLIPSLEKSGDEAANLGKIVVATIKGMMGTTLGANVEGTAEATIENKIARSSTPFMTVFDEVGYYTAPGMAVMAAQARSLGFSLIFSSQDIPALQKSIKEEAKSITANCNIKIFGRLADPHETREFFKSVVDDEPVLQTSSLQKQKGSLTGSFHDGGSTSVTMMVKATWGEVQKAKEGEAVISFDDSIKGMQIFYTALSFAKAMRVQRFVALPKDDKEHIAQSAHFSKLRDRLMSKSWTAQGASIETQHSEKFEILKEEFEDEHTSSDPVMSGAMAMAHYHVVNNNLALEDIDDISKPSAPAKSKSSSTEEATESKSPLSGLAKSKKKATVTEGQSWSDFVGDSSSDKTQKDDEDDDEESQSSGGSGNVHPSQFDATDAVDQVSNDGQVNFPIGLNQEVQKILGAAAESVKSGLFGSPEITGQQADAKATPSGSKPR